MVTVDRQQRGMGGGGCTSKGDVANPPDGWVCWVLARSGLPPGRRYRRPQQRNKKVRSLVRGHAYPVAVFAAV